MNENVFWLNLCNNYPKNVAIDKRVEKLISCSHEALSIASRQLKPITDSLNKPVQLLKFTKELFVIEPLLLGIVMGLVPVTLAGLFVAAYIQYKRGNQLTD